MVESAAGVSVDDILTSGKDRYAKDVTARAQQKLNAAGAGVTIKALELTRVSMPQEVSEVYEKVNAATVDASTQIENARQYRETIIPQAQATAAKAVSDAASAYSKAISEANAELVEFWGLLEEYKLHPSVVKTRVHNEKIAQIIEKIGEVKIVKDGDSRIFIE